MINIRSAGELLSSKDDLGPEHFVLNGLLRGHIGLLVAAPNVGKSHAILTLGLECASGEQILGLAIPNNKFKTLIYSAEDHELIVKDRLQSKLNVLSAETKSSIFDNLFFLTANDIGAVVIPPDSSNSEKIAHDKFLDQFIESVTGFDLIIIDTITEAVGATDLVKHDVHIKNTFQKIASKSGASILLVHHVNKSEISGKEKITMASGAGLSSVMRLTKLMIGLEKKKETLELTYLKHNYIKDLSVMPKVFKISGALTVNPDIYAKKHSKDKCAHSNRRSIVNGHTGVVGRLAAPPTIKLAGVEKTDRQSRSARNII